MSMADGLTKRNKILTLRFSERERALLDRRAAELGMSASAYCRERLLSKQNNMEGWPKQKLASALCRHHALVEQFDSDITSTRLMYEWEKSVWQLIR